MALNIAKLGQNVGGAKFLSRKILIYGDPGSGKTHLIGSAQDVPEMQDVLVVDLDGGSSTLHSRGDISGVSVRDVSSTMQVLWALAQNAPEVSNIRTVVLDGCSELQKRDLADIATDAAKKKSTRSEDLNELQDYKLNKARMLRLFRMARDIPDRVVIATAWAKKTFPKTPDGKTAPGAMPTLISPDLSDGISDTVMGAFDDVFYLFFDTTTNTRRLVVNNYDVVRAKTRNADIAAGLSNAKGAPIVDNPSFSILYKAYKAATQNKKESK